ncbi:hypothetical protein Gotur_008088, partial [Gossypium turneri]
MGTYRKCGCFTRKFKIIKAAPPPDVIAVFKKYTEGGPQMTAEQLHRFLVDAQGQGGTKVSDAEEILLQGLQKRTPYGEASLAFTSLVIAAVPTLF